MLESPRRLNVGYMKWARAWDCCQGCSTTQRPHVGRGLCEKCYAGRYYLENRERLLRRRAGYVRAHREECYSQTREWHVAHRVRNNRRRRRWWADNREERLRYYVKYRQTPKGQFISKAGRRRYRARKNRARGFHTWMEWYQLCEGFGYLLLPSGALYVPCLCCGEILPFDKITEDHIVPLSEGGTDFIENIQPLCLSCNSAKCNRTVDFRGDKYIDSSA